jgi:PilZ domain-containing protein
LRNRDRIAYRVSQQFTRGGFMAQVSLSLNRRRSGRIDVELPIQVAGTDSTGRGFIVHTRTQVVSRYGAKIFVSHGLVPEQILQLSCPSVGRDAEARVIALFGKEKNGFSYGIEFLNCDVDFWNMPFPAVT